ncbi:MAG TPA: restriction endonuclease [Pseudonocardiaceae bacterium]|nr:restriction endonuclease [Pseudonocardiaceae bacterium]
MMFEAPLVGRFNHLKASPDPHGRGQAFELLLVDVFRASHFRVEHNPRAATPRQTDLFAVYGTDRYLIEVKWTKQPVDIGVVADVRDRLDRTDATVMGVVFSVAGFGLNAIEEVEGHRGRPILLFAEAELLRVLEHPDELVRLLRKKRQDLVVHARAHLALAKPTRPTDPRTITSLTGADVQLMGRNGSCLPYLTTAGGFGQFVYAQDLVDIDWVPGSGNGVSLDMSLSPYTADGIVDVLSELDRIGWVTVKPRRSIQQSTANWHGVGVQDFITALRDWKSGREESSMPITPRS